MISLLLSILKYGVMLTGIYFFVYFLNHNNGIRNVKPIFIITVLILISTIFPLIKILDKSYSILDFIFSGSVPLALMELGYILSLLLLLLNNRFLDHVSFFVYIASIVFTYLGLTESVPASAVNANKIPGVIYFMWYIIPPLITLLVYLVFLDDNAYNKSKEQ